MKKQEISEVLKQAAQLRCHLCTAIDRCFRTQFRRLPLSSSSPSHPRSALCGTENGSQPSPFFSAAVVEARSLASIRDALVVLEEQLECLQMLPDDRKADKKATLAELEESREIFLRRVKHYEGQEVAVIQEALTFVGDEGRPLRSRSNRVPARLVDGDSRHKITGEAEGCMNEVCTFMNKRIDKFDQAVMKHEGSTRFHSIWSGLRCRLLGFLNRKLVKVSAKCLFTVAGGAAVLALSNTVYGGYTPGRKRASSMGRLNGVGQGVLTVPFKEKILMLDYKPTGTQSCGL